MSTDHVEKTHPVAGYIFAIVLGVLAFYLVVALNDMKTALFALPLLAGWAVVSMWLFGRPLDQDAHKSH
ncbi:MAG: hypothetical protein WC005_09770 [Candidatus Nanopelagicales bacterium]